MENKQLRIIETAHKLFLRHGYKKVTMSDIAEALDVSRPTLYASFQNKEAIFSALAKMHLEANIAKLPALLETKKTLRKKLECIFDVWIIEPFASVIDSENGKDLLENGSTYAPTEIAKVYTEFESQLVQLLKPEFKKRKDLSAQDIAHILMLATKGLKMSTDTLEELRRMTDGLISMTVAVVEKD